MPSRRDYLAGGAAALAAVAGCAESGSPASEPTSAEPSTTADASTSAPTRLSWGETTTVQGTSVTPRAVAVQDSAYYLATPDTLDVLSFDDRQAVFAAVSVDGESRPAPGDFALDIEDAVPGWVTYGDVSGSEFWERAASYDPGENGIGWVGFDAPKSVATDDPRLRVQFGDESGAPVSWSLPDYATGRLREPPKFACADFSAPESVASDEPIEVSVRVSNEGAGVGRFRGALNEAGPAYRFETVKIDVGPGESREVTGFLDTHVGSQDVDRVSFAFRTPCGDFERTVEVTDA
ncbi:hypothetical protein [Halobacterium litoreum]|uniref:Tat (Twin-arginine translocation) pathway signal sequence n=1 Tax=Halobacterium litoreum TaxID=2039234 RepID=A0ABD5NF91_9EURY|nr:hypothetical protein [Halobacterium litoreum]UHH13183.1 hypothetical protein LT972_13630 [Halobacterium litoreum]